MLVKAAVLTDYLPDISKFIIVIPKKYIQLDLQLELMRK